jgi:hypothetical protein
MSPAPARVRAGASKYYAERTTRFPIDFCGIPLVGRGQHPDNSCPPAQKATPPFLTHPLRMPQDTTPFWRVAKISEAATAPKSIRRSVRSSPSSWGRTTDAACCRTSDVAVVFSRPLRCEEKYRRPFRRGPPRQVNAHIRFSSPRIVSCSVLVTSRRTADVHSAC